MQTVLCMLPSILHVVAEINVIANDAYCLNISQLQELPVSNRIDWCKQCYYRNPEWGYVD
jgi:hypothetical protein